jgi:UDP-glucose 4-epimerase
MSLPAQKYKKALILGAAGFIGINLVKELVHAGFEVVCFDIVISEQWPDGVRAIVGDFLQPPAELLSEMDQAYIFHLVSSCRPSPSTTQAANEVSRDLVSTINYLEHTKDKDVRWIFYLLAEPFMDKKMQDLFLSPVRRIPSAHTGW